jgi:cysteine desulfurase/selenocysteine lyase
MNFKKDFPIFTTYPELIYLDNGATTQKPQAMINALQDYYVTKNSNIGRSVYKLAELSENAYEESRKKIANFVGANKKNIIFTSGCTDALNQVAYLAGQILKPKQKIILSIFEHHANILPWQRLAKEKNLELVFIDNQNYLANPETIPIEFWDNVGLVALTHVSNVNGQIHPIEKWVAVSKLNNSLICIDGAQGIVSERINVTTLGCDFYAFSAHKLYGPMGLGILYIHPNMVNKFLEPKNLGGGIIEDVEKDKYILLENATRFEAGTPNVADIYAFGKTLDYLNSNNWDELLLESHKLNEYLLSQLNTLEGISIIQSPNLPISHMVSFVVKGIHAHDMGTFLSNYNIAVRVGKHCTHPLHTFLGINSSVRVSLGIYNTKSDIDFLISKIIEAQTFFGA